VKNGDSKLVLDCGRLPSARWQTQKLKTWVKSFDGAAILYKCPGMFQFVDKINKISTFATTTTTTTICISRPRNVLMIYDACVRLITMNQLRMFHTTKLDHLTIDPNLTCSL
jgi:hypothetical protein